jgi:type I site-specific restriction-modification system R (restriction) subunit
MITENQTVADFTKKLQEWGWFSSNENFRWQRQNKKEVFCRSELFQQLKKINRNLNDSEISQGIDKLLSDKNHTAIFTSLLKITSFTTTSGEKKFIKFIDFEELDNNYFSYVSWGGVSREGLQIISQNNKPLEPDLILFINHLPLVICEFKKFGNIDWKEAAYSSSKGGNIRKYQKELPDLFLFNAFNVLSNGQDYCIGTIDSELFNYTPWRWEKNNIFHQTTFLDVIRNFLVLNQNKKWRIIRYHQLQEAESPTLWFF